MSKLKGVFLALLVCLVLCGTAFAGINPHGNPNPGGGTHSVPEPLSIILVGAGLAAVGVFAVKKSKKK